MTPSACQKHVPQYLYTDTTATHVALLRGVEFQTHGTSSTPLNHVLHANIPCAVCHTPSAWTRTLKQSLEVCGFETFGTSTTLLNDLLQVNLPCALYHTDTKLPVLAVPAQYTCPSGWSIEYNGYLVYLTRATCDGLPCPPYNNNMALPCAVCSK